MPIITKSDKIDKRTTVKKTTRTKSDWLSPTQFSLKHGFPRDITKEITQDLYKKGLRLKNITHTPMVIKNTKSHRTGPTPVLINPDATEIIIEKIKTRMAR